MGVHKIKRPVYSGGYVDASSMLRGDGFADEKAEVKTLSGGSTGTVPASTLIGRGTSFIVSTGTGAGWTVNLSSPVRTGTIKRILVDANSTVPVTVRTGSSSHVFFGSTANSFVFSTGLVTPKRVQLIAKSTSQWAIMNMSTGVTVAAATA